MGIDPIIFTIRLGAIQIPVRWYGVLIVTGAIVAAWYAAWYVKRRGQNPEIVWDAMVWLLISGIIGARIWYVIADIIGGNTRYLDNPVQILLINQGGLNILGGIMVGAVVGWYYTRRNNLDFWLLADGVGVGLLLGQAIGRFGNFINQELYGPPTTLPWGIPIDGAHRIPPWNDLAQFPVETTLFHPTFAYQAIWNVIMAALLTWLIIKKGDQLRVGVVAALWLIVAGVGRTWIEFFRPDQPRFFGTPVSTSTIISIIFALLGLFILLVKTGKISVGFMKPGTTSQVDQKPTRRPQRARR
jgi:phosphatidylglycerol:prolipoprotein diacylglycerol transferase